MFIYFYLIFYHFQLLFHNIFCNNKFMKSAKITKQKAILDKLTTNNRNNNSFQQIQTQRQPRSPMFSRTGFATKKIKTILTQKCNGESSLERELKFTKNLKSQQKLNDSLTRTQNNILHLANMKLEESQSQIQKRKKKSKEKSQKRNLDTSRTKFLDQISMISNNKLRSCVGQKNEEFYIYWKKKAHQYLSSNIKLMDQNRKLTKENTSLRKDLQIVNLQSIKVNQTKEKQTKSNYQIQINQEIRNISSIYIQKIQQMELVLKKKDVMIASLELQLKNLGIKLLGDTERVRLVNKMKQEIDMLQSQNYQLKYFVEKGNYINYESLETTNSTENKSYGNIYK